MSGSEAVELFRYRLSLLAGDSACLKKYGNYYAGANFIRSGIILGLKHQGVAGNERTHINDAIAPYMPNYKSWLYMKAPVCGLCLFPIASLEEATIDHIKPRSLGGENRGANKQLAHAKCNNFKSDRPIKSFQELRGDSNG